MTAEQQQRMYDTLKKIAKGYMTPKQIKRDSGGSGLDYEEYLEMAYENIQTDAARAIKGVRLHHQTGNGRYGR